MSATTVVEHAGARLHVHRTGAGPPLLWLHGLAHFGQLARLDAPPGFEVIHYDQRGHGEATALSDASAYTPERFADDAAAVLRALDCGPCAVGGTSMGASVALRLATDHPNLVRRLLLVAPAFGDAPNPAAAGFAAMADEIEAHGVEGLLERRRRASAASSDASDARMALWTHHTRTTLPTLLRTVGAWIPFSDLRELAVIGKPAAIVAWPDDPMHPLELAERIAGRLGASLGVIESLERALAEPTALGALLREMISGP